MEIPDRQQLFDYYDARAPEYEEFYDGMTSRHLYAPALIRKEVNILKKLLRSHARGRCIDVACGTGFWLQAYESHCNTITLIDQSGNALAECLKKIEKLGIGHKTEMLRGDIFSYPYAPQAYDTAVVAFLISHLTDNEIDALIQALKILLVPGGRFVLMDNLWNEVTASIPRNKIGMVTRTLKDGRQYRIFKRYFEISDLEDMAGRNDFNPDIDYHGEVFFFASGSFSEARDGKPAP